jgi:uncharacterized protein YcfL
MARKRQIKVAGLNIRAFPHSPEIYTNLMMDAFELRRQISIQRQTNMLLSYIKSINPAVLIGEFVRFTTIDQDLPWFDAEKLQVAEQEDMKKVIIPPNLKPNLNALSFKFDVENHLLVFENIHQDRRISPKTALKFFSTLFSEEDIVSKYGDVEVTIISGHEGLDHVFALKTIRRLEIIVSRMNPDVLPDLEDDVNERLEIQDARKLGITYDAQTGKGIRPDKRTRKLCEFAAANGQVITRGKDANNIIVTRSTEEHPLSETDKYDPDKESVSQAFDRTSQNFISKAKKLFFAQ